jgi:hypothetical protein
MPTPVLRYPNKQIKDIDDYLQISIVKYQPPSPTSGVNNLSFVTSTELINAQNIESTVAFIMLPMPQNISDENAVNWGNGDELNPLAALGAEQFTNVLQSSDFAKGVTKGFEQLVNTTYSASVGGNAQDLATATFTSKLVNLLGGNTTGASILSRATGQVLNPNLELLFQGVKLRAFNFDFDFTPRDPIEAQIIKQIIRTFKKGMAPRTNATGLPGSGLFVSAPNVFKLQYKSGNSKHPFLHSFKPAALINMSVNYTGTNGYATYDDATPVQMKMSLSFQELNPIYFEDYKDSDIGVGY